MATKKFSEYAIEGNNVTLTYDNVNDTVTFDVNVDKNDVGLGNVDNTSDVNKPISTAVQTALNGKQDSLGFTAENIANKSISVTTDQASNTKYPSVKSVYDWAVGAFQPILGFTPVTNARTLTINGTTYDLSANRTWSVGDLVSSGSYSNPTWLTSLAWGKVTGTPTTLSGYGITDAVPSSRTLTINGTSYDLSADRSWTISTATPTLAQVTTAGNTTTNNITVNKLTISGIGETYNMIVGSASDPTNWNQFISTEGTGEYGIYQDAFYFQALATLSNGIRFFATTGSTPNLQIFQNGGVAINTTTNAGYGLDVNGTARIQGRTDITVSSPTSYAFVINYGGSSGHMFTPTNAKLYKLSVTGDYQSQAVGALNPILNVAGSVTASSALAQGVYFNNTLVAAANNDVLVGLDINPTFTNGAFTGVSNYAFRIVNNGITRTSITRLGIQEWYLNNGITDVGRIAYSTPGGFPGIIIYTGYNSNRFNLTNNGSYFGLAYDADGTGNGRLNIFNGGVGIGTSTNAGYGLDVNGSTRLNGALTLGMTPIAAASVVSTHKLQITIAGTTYYLLASNV